MSLSAIITQLRTGNADFNDVADGFELLADWRTYTPSLSASGSMTWGTISTNTLRYRVYGSAATGEYAMQIIGAIQATTGGTGDLSLFITIPSGWNVGATTYDGACQYIDTGARSAGVYRIASANRIDLRKGAAGNWTIGAGRGAGIDITLRVTP